MASVVSTVPGGLETPDFLDLRKNAAVRTLPEDTGPRQLYQVVPEKQTAVRGLMGSERGYDVSSLSRPDVPVLGQEQRGKVGCFGSFSRFFDAYLDFEQKKGGVEMSIDASELEGGISEDQLRRRYEEGSKSSAGNSVHVPGGREDFSDMVAENAKKRQQKQDAKRKEREKEFKF